MTETITWPSDTDGDMLRILGERDFDFDTVHNIEFYVEFAAWPLSEVQQTEISKILPEASYLEPNEEDELPGHVLFIVKNKVTHEFVTEEQKRLTSMVAEIGGFCNSWAVCSPCGS
ncbi:ribonuclease E inhibitor RraB [Pseudoalteromonas luteoviolacea]|uniref:ribonuclease E inhibitor RraB n=1 Tax=Pseudoalteromonas luteoviolacea TaxID=43657 RepID=UPI00114F67E4|nr:ribonuclease E inhibitor RraB [Pseudoalteromonas luteoviolacea]TQF70064.1 ribonuclease E inhibitor RraB [Pseudoalteromonas luteoviolacea]